MRWRGSRLRKCIGKAKFLDLMACLAPLLGQLDPDARGAEAGIPRQIDDGENPERLVHSNKEARPEFLPGPVYVMAERGFWIGITGGGNGIGVELGKAFLRNERRPASLVHTPI